MQAHVVDTAPPAAPTHRFTDFRMPHAIPFVAVHLAVFGALWSGVTWQALVACVLLYVARMFGITAGYHRYFSHRTFKTGRVVQFLLALLAQSSAQRSVLWWAAHHRAHHKHSDTPADPHSPVLDSFWYAHFGWIFDRKNDAVDYDQIRDMARYPELRWLDRHDLVPPVLLGLITFLLLGWSGLFIGFALSTVFTWHATFAINSLAHRLGSRRFDTDDDSRNNFWLALLTLGEGWHNNHHHYQSSTRQGFRWWEVDATYYALWLLARLRLVSGLRPVPPRLRAAA